jgi:hypothetical protein
MRFNLEEAKSVVRKLNKAIAMMEYDPKYRNKVIAMTTTLVETSSSDRMVAVAGFEDWSKERQEGYLKRHPGSKRSKGGGADTPAGKKEKKTSVKLTSDEQARKDRLLESQKKKKSDKPSKAKKAKKPLSAVQKKIIDAANNRSIKSAKGKKLSESEKTRVSNTLGNKPASSKKK